MLYIWDTLLLLYKNYHLQNYGNVCFHLDFHYFFLYVRQMTRQNILFFDKPQTVLFFHWNKIHFYISGLNQLKKKHNRKYSTTLSGWRTNHTAKLKINFDFS